MLLQTRWASVLNSLLRTPFPSWTDFVPTTQGFGSVQVGFSRYQFTNNLCQIQNYFLCGTPTVDQAQFQLPLGATIDLPSNLSGATTIPGILLCGRALTDNVSASWAGDISIQATGGLTYLTFGVIQNNVNPFTAAAGNNLGAAGKIIAFNVTVPIQV